AGGGSAGGGPIDTYVCVTCANSLDTNPGTQASPFRTIARGIAVAQQLGRPTVFVGSAQGTPTAYAENIAIPAGVVVQGRWTVSSTFSWVRTGNRTLLINLTTTGVTFAPGAGRTSGLDGIRVQSSGAISGATTVSAISIVDASPTLRDFEVDPPGGGLPAPATAAGVSVVGSGSSTARPNPRLEGLMTARSDVQAGAASTNSFGLVVNNASVDTEFLDVRGGNTNSSGPSSPATSAGLFLIDGVGTTFRSSTAISGIASGGTCAGIAAGGNTSNVVIDQSEARGCTGIPNGLNPPLASVGVSFSNCTAIGPGSGNPRLVATLVQGGVAQGPTSYVAGVLASNGCPLQIEGNTIAGSNAVTLVPQNAAGVICTHEQQNGVGGANSNCRIANNRGITGGRAIQASIGLACVGNCATGTASCTGSCTEVLNNSASGQDARLVVHGFVTQSSPRIARNTFGGDGQQCTNTGGNNPFLYGLRLEGSSSRVENNLVIGGVCPSVIAFEQANVRRSGDMSAPAPDVHSNTFVPVTGATGIGMSTLIVGVAVRSQSPVALFSPMGSYRNNIITALGFATVRFAFQEADASSDPAVLEHNDFWAPTIAGMPPLYLNEGTTTLNGAGQINGLNGMGVSAFNNLSNDPGFIANFRISTTSQMRAAGGATGAPVDDIDGQRRPTPVNTAPDIGCDETQ
ncbi:MAG: hypothetical protein Q8L14_20940, partial [Myxococcales bacterium]|nr:hypothetical protein [Myxococcales bacterium]